MPAKAAVQVQQKPRGGQRLGPVFAFARPGVGTPPRQRSGRSPGMPVINSNSRTIRIPQVTLQTCVAVEPQHVQADG